MKILNITHASDMDGRGCEILTKLVFEDNEIILTEPSLLYDVISDLINNKEYLKYDEIFITDLGIHEKTAVLIDEYLKDKVHHIDHHTTEIFNKYDWSYIDEIREDGFMPSATSLYYEYLKDRFNLDILNYKSLEDLVEGIRCQDTYTFKKYNNTLGPDLTTVFSNVTDEEEFINSIIERIKTNKDEFIFTDSENKIIEDNKNAIEDYLNECERRMQVINYDKYKVGLSISTKYRSIVGNVLNERHPELDFILIADFNREKFSARTIHDNINLNDICFKLGGGGHPKAAGFDMTPDNLLIFKDYLGNIDRNNLF